MRSSALQSIVVTSSPRRAIRARIITGDAAAEPPRLAILRLSPGIPTMRRSFLLLPFCLALAALAGCGNKGPLVLPSQPAAASTTVKPAAPALPASVEEPAAGQY